jgi:hypothetical protein
MVSYLSAMNAPLSIHSAHHRHSSSFLLYPPLRGYPAHFLHRAPFTQLPFPALLGYPAHSNHKCSHIELFKILLFLIILLVQTDTQCSNQSEIHARRNLHAVRLLAEENVLAAEDFAVDARDYCACCA